jgi:hypothetical protein
MLILGGKGQNAIALRHSDKHRLSAGYQVMPTDHIEKALKKELGRIDKKLKRAETLRLAALIASAAVVGWALSTVTSHIPLLAGMAAGGVLLNAMATRVVSRKK